MFASPANSYIKQGRNERGTEVMALLIPHTTHRVKAAIRERDRRSKRDS
jgi:hypothetical protein